jgi:hypothetical protein
LIARPDPELPKYQETDASARAGVHAHAYMIAALAATFGSLNKKPRINARFCVDNIRVLSRIIQPSVILLCVGHSVQILA